MTTRPKESGFVYVADMGYDADSGFKGVTPPPSRPATHTQPPVGPHRYLSPVIEDLQSPPPLPPRRPTPPRHGPPPLSERPLPPRPSEPQLPRDVEANPMNKGIHHSHPRHLSVLRSAGLLFVFCSV